MNKVTCGVIRDLLPLYIDDCCSPESRTIVEEHLTTCPDCKQEWEEAVQGGPLFLDNVADDLLEKLSEEKPTKIMKKGLKKMKRKWVISITAVAVAAILIVPLGILTFNQSRAYGVSFTGLNEIRIANAFLSELKNNDPEAAFEHIDLSFWRWRFEGFQFDEDTMSTFEADLKAQFIEQASALVEAGGISDFQYLSSTWINKLEPLGGTDCHQLNYSVTVGGDTCTLALCITDNGVTGMLDATYNDNLPPVLDELDQYSSIVLHRYMDS